MTNLKFFVLFVLTAVIFGFPCGTEALVCRCSDMVSTCVNGQHTCANGVTECMKLTRMYKPEHGGDILYSVKCNSERTPPYPLPPEGNNGFCAYRFRPLATSSYCYCNTDLCIPPEPNLPVPPPRPPALVCKCTPSPRPDYYYDCIDGKQICRKGTKECLKTTLTQDGRPPQTILTCNENVLAQPVAPDGKCETTTDEDLLTRENCFCDTDLCDAGNVLRSSYWIPLSTFASAIIVSAFVGGR